MRSQPSSPSSTPASSPSTTDVLVTGFGPFLSYDENPSEQAVRLVASQTTLPTAVLPVDVEVGPRIALDLLAGYGARALLAFGLDASRSSVMVERLAVNLYEHVDESRPLTPGGAPAYWSTLPVREIRDAIRGVGVVCDFSLAAGAFVCNAVLYRALEAGIPACFVHLPQGLSPDRGAAVVAAAVAAC